MPTALAPLLLALAAPAAGEPAIVLTPARAATPAPLSAQCGPAARQGGGSDVECLISRGGDAPAPEMRILIRTTPAAPCRALAAQAVAVPAAAAPPRRGLPEVVQAVREPSCQR